MCVAGRSLHSRGYVHSSAGNISARWGDGFLITPTDASLGALVPTDMVFVDAQGRSVAGSCPSKTLHLHRAIYEQSPSARCIVHTHSTNLVALTLTGVWHPDCVLPPLTPYMVMKVGEIPLVPYALPGAAEVIPVVAGKLGERPHIRGVLLDKLGPVVWGASPRDASHVLEELEETARLWLLTAGTRSRLTNAQVDELCKRFNVVWTCRDGAPVI
jgi:ribulose-5-phosphate 4-epimerase/fuculose-1-phosphate aldolase